MSTMLEAMRNAIAQCPDKYRTYIEACAAAAEQILTSVTSSSDIAGITRQMRANSERWFPHIHSAESTIPLHVFYALGLAGESGEAVDEIKKSIRFGPTDKNRTSKLGSELADVFTYLLLIADELGIDIVAEYHAKTIVNESRFGQHG